jgi:beta-glucosidase
VLSLLIDNRSRHTLANPRASRLALEMPGPPKHRTLEAVKAAYDLGQITDHDLDRCARAVIKLLKQTGKLDDRREKPAERAVNDPDHQQLIREAGAEGIVLLKNSNAALPIDTTKIKKVALLGPLAKYAAAHGGGSASLNCHYKVSPYDAFRQRVGDQVELTYSKGWRGIFTSQNSESELTIFNSRMSYFPSLPRLDRRHDKQSR